jgi:hypothetical protein
MKSNLKHVYAVIRIDPDLQEFGLESAFTIKEIVYTLEEAEKEVKRLNRINRQKNCRYFLQLTRLIAPSEYKSAYQIASFSIWPFVFAVARRLI